MNFKCHSKSIKFAETVRQNEGGHTADEVDTERFVILILKLRRKSKLKTLEDDRRLLKNIENIKMAAKFQRKLNLRGKIMAEKYLKLNV